MNGDEVMPSESNNRRRYESDPYLRYHTPEERALANDLTIGFLLWLVHRPIDAARALADAISRRGRKTG